MVQSTAPRGNDIGYLKTSDPEIAVMQNHIKGVSGPLSVSGFMGLEFLMKAGYSNPKSQSITLQMWRNLKNKPFL